MCLCMGVYTTGRTESDLVCLQLLVSLLGGILKHDLGFTLVPIFAQSF